MQEQDDRDCSRTIAFAASMVCYVDGEIQLVSEALQLAAGFRQESFALDWIVCAALAAA